MLSQIWDSLVLTLFMGRNDAFYPLHELEGKTVYCHCEENEKYHGYILIKLVTQEKPTLIR